jgi:hypothetical protein
VKIHPLLVAVAALTSVGPTAHSAPEPAPAKPAPGPQPGPQPPGVVLKRPDLVCSVMASSKQDGTAPIPNGSTKIFIGNGHKVWIFANAMNQGQVKAQHFYTRMGVNNNGTLAGTLTHIQPSLDPGAMKRHAPVGIEIKDGQNKIKAYAELDGPNTVAELSENNNKCEIEFTAIVKAGK